MLVIAKDTESALIQKLKSCWETLPNHRCLQLKLSQIKDPSGNVVPEDTIKEWLDVIFNTFREAVDDQSSEFYVCRDTDVFILTRTLTQKRVDEALSHLAPQLTPALLSPGLAPLFEIGVDWSRLRQICKKKIEAIELARALRDQNKREELEKISKREVLKAINLDLIKTLSSRRQKRDEIHIMVVEDDPFSQKMVGNALKGKYEVSMSGDGAGALMGYVNKAPDVLFLDIGLPDINGHEVLERLFKIDPDAYVIMFSGNGDRENVLKAIELGAKGFVGKPFTKDKLFAYIEKSPFIQQKQNKENVNEYSVY